MPIQDISQKLDQDNSDLFKEILTQIQSSEKSENNDFIEFLQGLKQAKIEGSWNNQALIIASLDKFLQFPNWQDYIHHLPLALTTEHKEQIRNKIEILSPASTICFPEVISSKQA
ncbi:MAG: hypothetical protein EBT55_06685, partial [Proteobacteria bacterium]|nr:hypothetical protein [Pseudomonadota bacterium]